MLNGSLHSSSVRHVGFHFNSVPMMIHDRTQGAKLIKRLFRIIILRSFVLLLLWFFLFSSFWCCSVWYLIRHFILMPCMYHLVLQWPYHNRNHDNFQSNDNPMANDSPFKFHERYDAILSERRNKNLCHTLAEIHSPMAFVDILISCPI